jgi:cbb3-type cytochrome oxidase subunit 3
MSDFLPLIHWLDHYMIIVLMLMFVAIVVLTYWPGRKKNLEQQGQIPFKDDV